MNYPLGEVARVYELNGILRGPGRKHCAAPGKPCWPISEPAGRSFRPDNKARATNEGVFTYGLLACDFGSAINFVTTILDLLAGGCPQWGCVRPLPGSAIVRIHAYCRDEGPMPGLLLECGDRAAHLARMTRYIHDRIELQARKRLKITWNVAVDGNKAGAGRNRTRDPPCGARHLMTG